MKSFEWKDKFSVHVDEMDKHHKKILGYFNELQVAIQSGSATHKTEEILNALVKYANFHFIEEERLMRNMSHPGLDTQINHHAYFVDEVTEMTIQFKLGVFSGRSMSGFLGNWFIDHIMQEDSKYGEMMKQGKALS